MTRENKLALVVGFGLILFVGILISDHFSTVRSQQAANLANHDAAIDPMAVHHQDEGYIDIGKIAAPPPSEPNATALGNLPAPSDNPTTVEQPDASGLALTPDAIPKHAAETKTAAKPDEKTPEGFVPLPPEGTAVKVRHHEVHSGDSLYAICKQYYGDTSLLSALAKANSIDDPTNLKVGAKLLIPPAETIGGKAATPSVAKNEAAPGGASIDPNVHVKIEQTVKLPLKNPKATTAPPASSTPRATYIVKAGDSLRQIALRIYGSKENWKKLQDLNKDVIDDPDNLKVGTVLKL